MALHRRAPLVDRDNHHRMDVLQAPCNAMQQVYLARRRDRLLAPARCSKSTVTVSEDDWFVAGCQPTGCGSIVLHDDHPLASPHQHPPLCIPNVIHILCDENVMHHHLSHQHPGKVGNVCRHPSTCRCKFSDRQAQQGRFTATVLLGVLSTSLQRPSQVLASGMSVVDELAVMTLLRRGRQSHPARVFRNLVGSPMSCHKLGKALLVRRLLCDALFRQAVYRPRGFHWSGQCNAHRHTVRPRRRRDPTRREAGLAAEMPRARISVAALQRPRRLIGSIPRPLIHPQSSRKTCRSLRWCDAKSFGDGIDNPIVEVGKRTVSLDHGTGSTT